MARSDRRPRSARRRGSPDYRGRSPSDGDGVFASLDGLAVPSFAARCSPVMPARIIDGCHPPPASTPASASSPAYDFAGVTVEWRAMPMSPWTQVLVPPAPCATSWSARASPFSSAARITRWRAGGVALVRAVDLQTGRDARSCGAAFARTDGSPAPESCARIRAVKSYEDLPGASIPAPDRGARANACSPASSTAIGHFGASCRLRSLFGGTDAARSLRSRAPK